MRGFRSLLHRGAGLRGPLLTRAAQVAGVELIPTASDTAVGEGNILANQATVRIVHTWRTAYLSGIGLWVRCFRSIEVQVYEDHY